MEIREFEKKRAANFIWNSAHDYTIETGFRVYDEEGRADVYWNSVIGAIHRHYDWAALMRFYASFHETVDQGSYESLFWLALENAVFERERTMRPVFPYLRRRYAERRIGSLAGQISEDAAGQRILAVTYGHFRRALGRDAGLPDLVDVHLLDALELSGEADTGEIIERLTETLKKYFGFDPYGPRFLPGGRGFRSPLRRLSLRRRKRAPADGDPGAARGPVRRLSFGYGEHVSEYGSARWDQSGLRAAFAAGAAQAGDGSREYLSACFGRALPGEAETARLQREYCCGNHAGIRLHITRGEADSEAGGAMSETRRSYAGKLREEALRQREHNEQSFRAGESVFRVQIMRLTARLRNSLLSRLDERSLRGQTGTLNGGRVWRALYLGDNRIFEKTAREDAGNLTVDLLLDASSSQRPRQETVSAQGYMIAESLDRAGIPVRVSSFCSLSGYLVLNIYRDYHEKGRNREIFRYFTAGANRDGLAVRLAAGLMRDNSAEHRILIILSDCSPNDAAGMQGPAGNSRDYTGELGVEDAAAEVHAARMAGITVRNVFTGGDAALGNARRIYGADFIRIRGPEQFAEAVGTMLTDCIRLL
ncbi:hypothetical protein [Lachnoclostridium sp. Marseille-P6806]|uniref:hypothetical protein n=1 Tax=Lachnoclostridium sp. Marseille-P6806 TaxID=2364793 RepID=UPI0010303861|nr:hypothetical protein [Lachnoclostridium sp. Marseille-P6806]